MVREKVQLGNFESCEEMEEKEKAVGRGGNLCRGGAVPTHGLLW